MKQTIQTDLLGTRVVIGEEFGTAYGPSPEDAYQEGVIRNVYLDKNGDPKYSIQVIKTGELRDFYPCHFTIRPV